VRRMKIVCALVECRDIFLSSLSGSFMGRQAGQGEVPTIHQGPTHFHPPPTPPPPPSTRPPPVQEGLAASQVCRETSQGFAGIRWMDLVEEKTSTTEISIYIQVTNSPSYYFFILHGFH